jgi:hypothetical protein
MTTLQERATEIAELFQARSKAMFRSALFIKVALITVGSLVAAVVHLRLGIQSQRVRFGEVSIHWCSAHSSSRRRPALGCCRGYKQQARTFRWKKQARWCST